MIREGSSSYGEFASGLGEVLQTELNGDEVFSRLDTEASTINDLVYTMRARAATDRANGDSRQCRWREILHRALLPSPVTPCSKPVPLRFIPDHSAIRVSNRRGEKKSGPGSSSFQVSAPSSFCTLHSFARLSVRATSVVSFTRPISCDMGGRSWLAGGNADPLASRIKEFETLARAFALPTVSMHDVSGKFLDRNSSSKRKTRGEHTRVSLSQADEGVLQCFDACPELDRSAVSFEAVSNLDRFLEIDIECGMEHSREKERRRSIHRRSRRRREQRLELLQVRRGSDETKSS